MYFICFGVGCGGEFGGGSGGGGGGRGGVPPTYIMITALPPILLTIGTDNMLLCCNVRLTRQVVDYSTHKSTLLISAILPNCTVVLVSLATF